MADRKRARRASRATIHTTVHLPPALFAEVEALAAGTSRNSVLVALIQEGLRAGIEHQHGMLIEAAIDRAVGHRLARLEDLAARAAIHAYRGRWMLTREMVMQADRWTADPSEAAQERISRLNTESHRKARTWLGEQEAS